MLTRSRRWTGRGVRRLDSITFITSTVSSVPALWADRGRRLDVKWFLTVPLFDSVPKPALPATMSASDPSVFTSLSRGVLLVGNHGRLLLKVSITAYTDILCFNYAMIFSIKTLQNKFLDFIYRFIMVICVTKHKKWANIFTAQQRNVILRIFQ